MNQNNRTCKQIGAKQKFNQSVEEDIYLQEFQRVYNRMYLRYYRMDSWENNSPTNKLSEEDFKTWIAEAYRARQKYKFELISGNELINQILKT